MLEISRHDRNLQRIHVVLVLIRTLLESNFADQSLIFVLHGGRPESLGLLTARTKIGGKEGRKEA